jgi:hypothetical protein
MSQAALSPDRGGADAFAAVKQLALDALSSPLARVMHARAYSRSGAGSSAEIFRAQSLAVPAKLERGGLEVAH